MAKPKGTDIVGWSTNKTVYEKYITILAEKDVNQVKNRKSGQGATASSGHLVRQLGVARRLQPGWGSTPTATTYHIYTHSQVSNGTSFRYAPPAYVGLTREDMEWLFGVIAQELYGDKS